MKYLSLFSGIGGMELGIQQAYESNHHQPLAEIIKERPGRNRNTRIRKAVFHDRSRSALCVGFSEIDKYAIQIYEKNFKHKNLGDITKISTDSLPDFDLLVGGFPCQAFSIAGKRRGFADTRGTLFFEIARILKAKKPRLFLLENVKGLLSHDNGQTFATIISTLDVLGYDLQWQVLNSKDFGVPQNRERMFIIGHLRGTARPKVFPIEENGGVFGETNGAKKPQSQTKVASTVRARQAGRADDNFVVDVSYPSRLRKYIKTAPTVRNYGSGGNKMPLVSAIRRLTPVECERLQGFPYDWTGGVSDTQRYKCIGNAVTVTVIREIVKRMI